MYIFFNLVNIIIDLIYFIFYNYYASKIKER